MKLRRYGGSAAASLVVGLGFLAAGALILSLAPYRSLSCVHPERPEALACVAIEADGGVKPPECPLLPDIQCHLEAKVLGTVTSYDKSLVGVQDFGLLEDKVERRVTRQTRTRRGTVDRTLLFIAPTMKEPIDLGWHAKTFATLKYHDKLLAFARDPHAARIELTDNRLLPPLVGIVMMVLGLLATFSGFSGQR
jgi:hypothetical protein